MKITDSHRGGGGFGWEADTQNHLISASWICIKLLVRLSKEYFFLHELQLRNKDKEHLWWHLVILEFSLVIVH